MSIFNNRELNFVCLPDGLPAVYKDSGFDLWVEQAEMALDRLLDTDHHEWADKDEALSVLEAFTDLAALSGEAIPTQRLEAALAGKVKLKDIQTEAREYAIVSGPIAAQWTAQTLTKALGWQTAGNDPYQSTLTNPTKAKLIYYKNSYWKASGKKWIKVSKEEAGKRLTAISRAATPVYYEGKVAVVEGATPMPQFIDSALTALERACELPGCDAAEGVVECFSEDLFTGNQLMGASFDSERLILDPFTRTWDTQKGHSKSELWYGQRRYDAHWGGGDSWDSTKARLIEKAPQFYGFILDCSQFVPEGEQRELYQQRICQMVGQFSVGDTQNQKLWLLVGLGGTGKSVLQNLIIDLVGGHSSAYSTSFMGLGDKYSYANLAGKVCCNITELPTRPTGARQGDWDEAANTVKAMLGGDAREVRIKYQQSTPSMSVSVSVVAACNELPTFGGREAEATAWARRMLPIPFHSKVPEDRIDLNLPAKLKAEIPHIAGITGNFYLATTFQTHSYAEPQCATNVLLDSTQSKWQCVLDALEVVPEDAATTDADYVVVSDCKDYWCGYMEQSFPRGGDKGIASDIRNRFGVGHTERIRESNLTGDNTDTAGKFKQVRAYLGLRWKPEMLHSVREVVENVREEKAKKE